MFSKRILLAGIALTTVVTAHASMVDVYLSGGVAFSELNNQKHVMINSFLTNKYQTHKHTNTEPFYGIGVSHTFQDVFYKPINVALGISAYYQNYGKIAGIESPFINAGDFDTLNYHFKASSYSVFFEPRLIFSFYAFQPYLLAGIGTAWNTLGSYNEIPSNPAGSAAPAEHLFKRATKTFFAYEFGAGLQHEIFYDPMHCMDYALALEYRYMNNGAGHLGGFHGLSTEQHLRIANLSSQAVFLTLKATVL